MNRQELKILERAFECEINAALTENFGCHLLQTKSKIAKKLADEGYLTFEKLVINGRFPIVIEGYALTHVGRFTYCDSDLCKQVEE